MLTSPSNKISVGSIILLCIISCACKKFVTVESPSTVITEENVYKSDATAIAALTSIYADMASSEPFTGMNGVSLLCGLSADELTLASVVTQTNLLAHYRNELRSNSTESYGTEFWNKAYAFIFRCNAAIEGLNKSTSLSAPVKKQLLGEAEFIRAFMYFYLVNLYGGVPLALSTDVLLTASLPRSSIDDVYQQIVIDLKQAQELLSGSYLNKDLVTYGEGERIRPTSWAATALLARTYLYMSLYADAESETTKLIGNTTLFSLQELNVVFLRNSKEAIWQLQPVQSSRNTEDAFAFILPANGPNANQNPAYLSAQVLNAFEPGDLRRFGGNWIDSVNAGGTTYFYPFKYKAKGTSGAPSEYLMVFRLAEQYLIRAEARAHLNNTSGAQSDLDAVRTRAGLANTAANNQSSLLSAIFKERQVELFTEWGHRWLELKRTANVDQVMTLVTPTKANGNNWQSSQQLYPLPYSDVLKDPNLVQNDGY